jgi:hypothetical protein
VAKVTNEAMVDLEALKSEHEKLMCSIDKHMEDFTKEFTTMVQEAMAQDRQPFWAPKKSAIQGFPRQQGP